MKKLSLLLILAVFAGTMPGCSKSSDSPAAATTAAPAAAVVTGVATPAAVSVVTAK